MRLLIFTFLFFFASTANARWLTTEIGVIGTASDDILESAMDQVQKEGFTGLIIELDTPGGSLDATRSMVKKIMNAPFPVVVWVGPDGSRAGSAGAFITLAAHVAAMAEGTNIGAAHPIQADGSDVKNKHAAKKIEEDTAAFIESIAKSKGRNVEMARSFVVTSASITAKEALDNKVIDLIANNRNELLEKLHDRTVNLSSNSSVNLNTKSVATVAYEKTIKQQFLEIISNPNLFYLLFIAGLIGIGFELTHPGAMVPGVIGGICMILALIAMSVLPISFGALLLLLAGIAFMVAELFIPSFGILGIGGFSAFVIGSFLLVDPGNEQGLRISWFTIAPGALAVGLASMAIGFLVVRATNAKISSGQEGLVGQKGTVSADFLDQRGRVHVAGEDWSASSTDPLKKGDQIVVNKTSGLNLEVSIIKENESV